MAYTPAFGPGNAKDRRDFLKKLSLGMAVAVPGSSLLIGGCSPSSPQQEERENTIAGAVNEAPGRKLGVALVGLGGYSKGQLAPALQETEHCYLAGIVTGTPSKIPEWQQKYNVPDKNVYSYETFDQIADNPDIDIVYVVLPNGMHAEYSIRAAKAGKHVICEKPMAITVADCERMISASREAGKLLSIGYRLHFEPFNREMMRLGQEKVHGPVTGIKSENGFVLSNPNVWRVDKELSGGGPLMDMGVYSVQGARYTTGLEPIAVTARQEKTKPEIFKEVEETLYYQLEFPGGIMADCMTSYNKNAGRLRAEAQNGWFELEPAFGYDGKKGRTSKGPMDFPQVFEQALQMDDFAQCIRENRPSRVPGEMGLQDVRILQAIYEAMETGKKVRIQS